MKRLCLACVVLLLIVVPAGAGAQGPDWVSVTCDSGEVIEQGVEVVVNQMRSGFNYTATVIGINGFDPVLAVLDQSGSGLCNDDASVAAGYTATLPSTGAIAPSGLSSQVAFSQNSASTFADVSLVVGGFGGATGEFLLILEGMAATVEDNAGDPFSVFVSPGMVAGGVPLVTYMIGTDAVDPQINDPNGNMLCDDAGNNSLCPAQAPSLVGSFVTSANGRVEADTLDSMVNTNVGALQLNDNPSQNFLTQVMTRATGNTGRYVLAFHLGIGASPAGDLKDPGGDTQAAAQPTPVPPPSNLPAGVDVTCDNGAQFSNGVEIVVNQMRSGFNYTATAVGINGFDPVLAVLDETGSGLCNDDDSGAARYGANLPTTGLVSPSGLSSQVIFSQNSPDAFEDVSLVVGGFGNSTGEFIVILEGMAATAADGLGDPFSVRLTPGMVRSGVPLTIYMAKRGGQVLDPLIYQLSPEGGTATTADGTLVQCDDAGNPGLCYGNSSLLTSSTIDIATGTLRPTETDAMLSIPLNAMQLNADPDFNFLTFIMTSFAQSTEGQYLLVFHVGTAE